MMTSPLRILVAEDEPDLRELLRDLLQSINPSFKVILLSQAEEILNELSRSLSSEQSNEQSSEPSSELSNARPKLIIADLFLGGVMDGYDLWQICHKTYPDIPFLIISGMPFKEFRKNFLKGPEVPAYLSKPFTPPEFRDTIQRLLTITQRR